MDVGGRNETGEKDDHRCPERSGDCSATGRRLGVLGITEVNQSHDDGNGDALEPEFAQKISQWSCPGCRVP